MAILSIAKIMIQPGPSAFLRLAENARRSIKQAAAMPGCIEAVASPTGDKTAFAVSLWEDEASLQAYVHAGAHGDAAKELIEYATAHVSGHMEWDGPIPDWKQWGALLRDMKPRVIPMPLGRDLTAEDHLAGPRRRPAWPLKMAT